MLTAKFWNDKVGPFAPTTFPISFPWTYPLGPLLPKLGRLDEHSYRLSKSTPESSVPLLSIQPHSESVSRGGSERTGSQKGPIKGFYSRWDTTIRQAESKQTTAARERVGGFLRVRSRTPGRVGHPADLPQVSWI